MVWIAPAHRAHTPGQLDAVPTSVVMFQQRSHFVPSARSTWIRNPGICALSSVGRATFPREVLDTMNRNRRKSAY
jgi:hypothetical protein